MISIIINLAIISLLSFGCEKEIIEEIPTTIAQEYESCCGVEPTVHRIDGSYAFIPNVFTPNGDGLNDMFRPFLNENIVYIYYFEVFNETDTSKVLMHQAVEFSVEDLDENAWKGTNVKGEFHKGAFTYVIFFNTKDDKSFSVKGSGCSVICDEDSKIFKDKEGCFYPEQIDEKGEFSIEIEITEKECFE